MPHHGYPAAGAAAEVVEVAEARASRLDVAADLVLIEACRPAATLAAGGAPAADVPSRSPGHHLMEVDFAQIASRRLL